MFKNMGDIMKQAQQMQSKMKEMRDQLGSHEIEGQAGGGMVTVVLNGRSEPVRVHIDPQTVGDVEMLEDLVLAALRDAQDKVQEKVKELVRQEVGDIAGLPLGNLGIPGL